jgi:hypothetical protein
MREYTKVGGRLNRVFNVLVAAEPMFRCSSVVH